MNDTVIMPDPFAIMEEDATPVESKGAAPTSDDRTTQVYKFIERMYNLSDDEQKLLESKFDSYLVALKAFQGSQLRAASRKRGGEDAVESLQLERGDLIALAISIEEILEANKALADVMQGVISEHRMSAGRYVNDMRRVQMSGRDLTDADKAEAFFLGHTTR